MLKARMTRAFDFSIKKSTNPTPPLSVLAHVITSDNPLSTRFY
jgi:hypothetical protein